MKAAASRGAVRRAAESAVRVRPVRCAAGWGVEVEVEAGGATFEQPRPVGVVLASGSAAGRPAAYASVDDLEDGLRGRAMVSLGKARLSVVDEWRSRAGELRVRRHAAVIGGDEGGFSTTLTLRRALDAGWTDVEPFAPGAVYGDCPHVPALAIGSAELRERGVRHVLAREDRLAAPLFGVRYRDGVSLAVLHLAPGATTTMEDCVDVDGGETLVDARFTFASLGGVLRRGRVEVGAWLPGSEGETTYTSGGLPLRQVRGWRRRHQPIVDGLEQELLVAFRFGEGETTSDFRRHAWRWAWRSLAPSADPVDADTVLDACIDVLAATTVAAEGRAGIPLELDATTGHRAGGAAVAIMGFVGANTDAAYLLLRAGHQRGVERGARYRDLGARILDSFAAIGLSPPQGEGLDLDSGDVVTYRRYRDRAAVYARSIAEGCAAALDAWRLEREHGVEHDTWLRWVTAGGDWLVRAQQPDGSLPRAWEARSGEVLDASTSASYVVVPFLVALARATGDRSYLDAAVRAGEFVWRSSCDGACFAGATLDNPDVVDKEAAVLSLEAFLALHLETDDPEWLERAAVAAGAAETWIYVWNVPMPVDAEDAALHWKRDVPTAGHQLIAVGVSMADGFLAVNAAAFARLGELTGDEHFLDVARLVTHGTKAMLALPGRTFDLHGIGWQQEHWSFAGRRGVGLNRNWLPWVSVAHAKGITRLRDLDSPRAASVLAGHGGSS